MSRQNQLVALALTTAATLCCTSAAHASNDTGLEMGLRPAYGSAGSSSPVAYAPDAGVRLSGDPGRVWSKQASPYGGGFIGDAQLGWRPIRFLSFGMTGGIRSSSASDPGDGSTGLARSAWRIGPYVRGYIPAIAGFEPSLAIGVEYMHDAQSFKRQTSGVDADWKLTHYGVAIPMTIGLQYRFLEFFGVGPSFQYAPVVPVAGCAAPTAPGVNFSSFCSTDDGLKVSKAESYGVWSLGLDLRVTLF